MDYKVSGTDLTSVANAIRTKGGTSASLSFPDGFVTAIGNIETGGGSTLITKSITANGTYSASSDNADGYSSVTVAVPSKLVTGTFTGTTAGAAMDVTIPYSGTGYPVMITAYPSVGAYKSGSTFYTTVQQYAIDTYTMVKADISTTPGYSNSTNDKGTVVTSYKSSASDNTAINCNRSANESVYRNNNATAGYAYAVRFKSATTMSVFIAGTSYGFMKDVEYTYQIVYSS